jgi:hypothetical protein
VKAVSVCIFAGLSKFFTENDIVPFLLELVCLDSTIAAGVRDWYHNNRQSGSFGQP